MPDVSKATIYRYIRLLTDGGILEVDGEQRVGGTIERRYRLRQPRPLIDAEAAVSASLEDYRRAFAVAMAALLGEFNAYLDRGHADPVGFLQLSLGLSPDERYGLLGEMRSAIASRLKNRPEAGRRQHLLSPTLFPIEDPSLKPPRK